ALTGLEGPLLEAALHHHTGTLGQRLGHVLRLLPPDAAAQEQGLTVLPLARLLVKPARRARHREPGDRGTRRGEAELGIGGEIPDDGGDGLACHVSSSWGRS